jgi:hypothetical protein
MHTSLKHLLIALTTTIILTITATGASALRSLSLNPAGAIRTTAVALSFTSPENEATIASNVTLTGTLERAIQKREGVRVGTITRCETNRETIRGVAAGTTVRFRCEPLVPFTITYKTFLGTLPSITGILLLIRAGFLIATIFEGIKVNECLYEGNLGLLGRIVGGILERLEILPRDQAITLHLALEQALQACVRNQIFAGSFTLSPTQRITLV